MMSIMRLTIRMAVVLPQPEGPTRTQISPGRDLEREGVDRRLGRRPRSASSRRGTRGARLGWRTAPRTGRCRMRSQRSPWAGRGELIGRTQTGRATSRRVRRVLQARRRGGSSCVARCSRAMSQSANQAFFGQQRAVQVGADDAVARGRPRSPSRRCCRARAGRGRAGARRARGACGRRGSRSPPARAAPPARARPRSRRCRSAAARPRGRSAGRRGRARGSPRRRARRRGRGAGSRRRCRGRARRRPPRRAARRAWSSTRSCAHSAWSRSWPPPR